MIRKTNYVFKSEAIGCTPAERRERMIKALEGCTMRKKKRILHPESFRKVSTFISDEWADRSNHYRMCLKKDRYRSESEARKMINRILRYRPESKLRCYWCNYCGGWHLTHKADNGV